MFKSFKKILKYGIQTQDYPTKPLICPQFVGRPVVDGEKCNGCHVCVSRCPSGAIRLDKRNTAEISLGSCLFCTLCEELCPQKAIRLTNEFELSYDELSDTLRAKIYQSFGRSLKIREVDSGSCNGCDYEINGLNNPFNDIERLGISFVASPRHADMLLVTGTATRNMQLALKKTYEATPDPKLVVAVGACAISGGIFKGSYAAEDGIGSIVPVDVFIPGCPPRPQAILYGLLKALDRVK